MNKLIIILVVLLIGYCSILAIESYYVVKLDISVTNMKEKYDIVKNENIALQNEITSILAVEKLYQVAEKNKYITPTKENVVYLEND